MKKTPPWFWPYTIGHIFFIPGMAIALGLPGFFAACGISLIIGAFGQFLLLHIQAMTANKPDAL